MERTVNYITENKWLVVIGVCLFMITFVICVAMEASDPYDCSFYPPCDSKNIYTVKAYCFNGYVSLGSIQATCPEPNGDCSIKSYYNDIHSRVSVSKNIECQLDRRVGWKR